VNQPDRRIVPDKLPEFRRLVADRMSAYGWPMYEDDEGAVYLKVDGLFDATITATLAVVTGAVEPRHDEEEEPT
jgi:hypothetical protein